MAKGNGLLGTFIFGLIIFVLLIISGILGGFVDMILFALFATEYPMIALLVSIIIAIFILAFVFRLAGFRRK